MREAEGLQGGAGALEFGGCVFMGGFGVLEGALGGAVCVMGIRR